MKIQLNNLYVPYDAIIYTREQMTSISFNTYSNEKTTKNIHPITYYSPIYTNTYMDSDSY